MQGASCNSLEDEPLLLVVLGADERRDLLHVVLQPVEDGAHRPHDLVVARLAGRDELGDDAREDLALRGERDDAVARDRLAVPAQGLGVAEVLVDALLAVCARSLMSVACLRSRSTLLQISVASAVLVLRSFVRFPMRAEGLPALVLK